METNIVTGECSACGEEYSFKILKDVAVVRHRGHTDLCDACLYEKATSQPFPENDFDDKIQEYRWNGIPNESAWFENGVKSLEEQV